MQESILLAAMPYPGMATQGVFRLALSAMSEPGTLQQVDHAVVLDRLAPATYALCLTLFDADTPVWLAPSLDTPVLRANLAFHCACPIVQAREDAEFAVLTAAELADLAGFNAGSDRDPDISCTLQIGRASGRERVCQSVEIAVVAVSLK